MSTTHDNQRRLSSLDRLLGTVQAGLARSAQVEPPTTHAARTSPATARDQSTQLDATQRRHAAGLMRVNHAGEVAAQALYQGQAATAREPAVRQHLLAAADEERDHLDWCRDRVEALGEQTSLLDPLWYAGSWTIGALAGLAGDRVSLGFVAETERQVSAHLEEHLQHLPVDDQQSRDVLSQMLEDETRHGEEAVAMGGIELPSGIKRLMRATARIMTRTAYYF